MTVTENEKMIEKIFYHPNFGVSHSNEGCFYIDSKYVSEAMRDTLEEMYKWTKGELKNYFTYKEAWCLIGTFNSTLYDPVSISPKELLIAEISDDFRYGFNNLSNEEENELLDKLKSLTEFQCFTVVMLCYEFKNRPITSLTVSDEEVKKIFLIEDK